MDLIILFVVLLRISPLIRKEFNGEGDLNPATVDGASIAIDPDAFYNLNRVVKELFGGDTVTIPENVIIEGNLQCKGDVYFSGDKDETTPITNDITQDLSVQISNDDKSLYKSSRRFYSNLPTEFRNSEGYFCTLNWNDGNSYIRTKEFIVTNLNGSWGFGEGWDEKVPVPIRNTPYGLRVQHFISEGNAHMKFINDYNDIPPRFVNGFINSVAVEPKCPETLQVGATQDAAVAFAQEAATNVGDNIKNVANSVVDSVGF